MRASIRIRLSIALTVTIVTIWMLVIVATYLGAKKEVRDLFDTQLEQSARVATQALFGSPQADKMLDMSSGELANSVSEPKDQYKKNLVVQVWNSKGELFLRSKNAPAIPISNISSGFEDTLIDGENWRTYSFYDSTYGLTIRAGEPSLPRDYLTRHVISQTLYPIVIGLPVITLLIWFAVGRGLNPLKRLATEVHQRDPDKLDKIDAHYAPSEVRPLVQELNNLLSRLAGKIDQERRFIGDAAHELRTPLAGLRAQAEVAIGARNRKEQKHALNNILQGVDRASRIVNQLLILSRLDKSASISEETVELSGTIRSVLMDILTTADEKSIEVIYNYEGQDKAMIHGNAEAIYILVRNLVDNSIQYSPENSMVTVTLDSDRSNWVLTVRDQGPGIPESEMSTVFDRFSRCSNSTGYGSGLGLSIVKRVVELYHGTVSLENAEPEMGLGVVVCLQMIDPKPPGADKKVKLPFQRASAGQTIITEY